MRRLVPCLPLLLIVPLAPAQTPAEPLPEKDPLTFLEKCLERYDRSGVKGYRCTFIKQERISGELQPKETITAHFREQPHSVTFHWVEGARKATAVLYVEGENSGQMLCRPSGFAGKFVSVVSRDPEGSDAKQSGRYSLKDFGLRKATVRTQNAWKTAQEKGTLRIEYLGVRNLREAGDRPCYALRRTMAVPEEDGIVEGTFYFDKETWMQIGTVLKGKGGSLIATYYFRDVRINPEFAMNQFKRDALTP